MKKVLLMFLVSFTLFFSVSNAATIEANTPYSYNSSAFSNDTNFSPSELFGYTAQNIAGSVKAYIVDSDDTTLKPILKDLASKGYSKTIIYIALNGSLPTYCIDIYPDEFDFDFTFWKADSGTNSYNYIGLYAPANSYYYKFVQDRTAYTPIKITQTSTSDVYAYDRISIPDETNANWGSYHFLEFNGMSVKEVTMSSRLITWDGSSYFYKAETLEPDFEGITDNKKATIINSVVNSDAFKNTVPQNYRNQFFIVKDEFTSRYKVYFYPEQYYLKGRIFEEGSVEDVSYKSYKIIAFEGENFLWDLWQSINPFDYYVFSGYFNEDETFTSYFYEYKDSHELNQYYFSYQDEPIVYTSRDIGFLIYNIEDNSYTEDTENSIGSTTLKDSDGNDISIIIPTEEGSEDISFWDSIVSKIVSGIKAIFVPDTSSFLEFFEKLKTKFNFLFEVKDLVSGMFDKLVYQTEPPSLSIDLTASNSKYNWGTSAIVLDMSWYEPYKPVVDIFICAFIYGLFFWNLFRKASDIIMGVSGEVPEIEYQAEVASHNAKREPIGFRKK